jgi:hypothetical protein
MKYMYIPRGKAITILYEAVILISETHETPKGTMRYKYNVVCIPENRIEKMKVMTPVSPM